MNDGFTMGDKAEVKLECGHSLTPVGQQCAVCGEVVKQNNQQLENQDEDARLVKEQQTIEAKDVGDASDILK